MSICVTQEMEIEMDIDTSVYCGICGAGICSSSTIKSHKDHLEITAFCNACNDKIDGYDIIISEKEDEIFELQNRIKELEEEL